MDSTGNSSPPLRERNTPATGSYGPGHFVPQGDSGAQIMAADTLEGNKVKNPAGENLGEIEHIMLDVPSGRVAYAVLSFGGVLGIGGKLFAIPWSALTLDTREKCFRLNTDKERLKSAPGFDRNHWPVMADQSWAKDIHNYYGAQPYWE